MTLSLRAFARSQHVSLAAVQKAIAAGRLTAAALGEDDKGRPVILDAVKAAEEWAAHTRVYVAGRKGEAGNGASPSKLADATLREREARAESIELETDRKKRLLIPAREVEHRWSALVVGARTGLLGIPTRYKQRVPHASAADLVVLEALIREALEELAEQRSEHG